MNKKELAQRVQEDLKSSKLKLTLPEVNEIVTLVFDNMRNQIVKGGSIEIRTFGSFYSRLVSRRNMATGGKLKKWTIFFKPFKEMKDGINNG